MKKSDVEKLIDGLSAPKGCDWNFLCGYMLAKIHMKEKLRGKKK